MLSGKAGMKFDMTPTAPRKADITSIGVPGLADFQRRVAEGAAAAAAGEEVGEAPVMDAKLEKLQKKVEIREVKEKGATYWVAQAGVVGWFGMILAVIAKSI